MAIQEIRVKFTDRDIRGEGVLHDARRTLEVPNLEKVRTARVYRLEGISEEEALRLAQTLLCEPVNQEFRLNNQNVTKPFFPEATAVVEVAYNPGVMNPEAASIMKSAGDLGIYPLAVDSSTEYGFYGRVTPEDVNVVVKKLLANPTVERVVTQKPETLLIPGEVGPVKTISIRSATPDELMVLSTDKLFLNLQEMQVVQSYFAGLGRDPTDVELEIIAARWSEHCGHKTFRGKVILDGEEKPPLYTRLKETAELYFGDLVLSAFVDNSGVMRFYDGQALCGKVETHNSPSAIEPYGGAMTGSGGVFRDPAGTGQGAKIIASTDIFCFAPWDLKNEELPEGCLHPDYLQRRVVAGVGDYGNRMGIPTNNGSVHYHPDFKAKPTVIVGAYGILPEEKCQKGEPGVNDLLVVVGGRTGRDGIHGATFSSGEMTERTINVNAAAVQIGNAIEEKRMFDALIEARDGNLIRAITDCGAAGLSSAVGEMGEDIGVTVDISRVPLKYQGLAPWEIWLSEAQERMVTAVSPDNLDQFLAICKKYNVEATVLGNFDGSHQLIVNYGDKNVAQLDYKFLKNGLPQRVMKAHWEKPAFEEIEIEPPKNWLEIIKGILSHPNVCSKESIVRRYDHGVQGTNALPPFGGVKLDAPNDAVVLTPLSDEHGVVISHGLNPILNRIDPYEGSKWAVAEAMANYVAVGGDPDEACLINNYIWPYPDEEGMGSLDRSVDAVCDCMKALERPVISGKDSLSSTYRGKDGLVIKIPPVLCISVFGRIPDVSKTVTSDVKKSGSTLVLVGQLSEGLGGSTYYDINGFVGNETPKIDLKSLPKVLRTVHQAIKSGRVTACHDVSEGGVITTVAEMCFGGDCGVDLRLNSSNRPDSVLFNETAGCFIVEVKDDETARRLFGNVPYQILGRTKEEKEITVKQGNQPLFEVEIEKLKQAWQVPLRRIF